ncbi:helix-turn-helix domain-containing protein [Paenibacillus enshidis]|uniref:Helix-turn-helix domain-containing protein n=1 Tax=Paenibacillus enshidis TaxID=1458439 RepID=A0ABV5AZX8_9BACL
MKEWFTLVNSTTIRSEVEKFMELEKLSLSDLGRKTGLNVGSLSSIITGGRIMSVNQLDRITELMELPEGHFYDLYIQDNIAAAQPNWRRLRPFIFKCAELNKLDCIRQVTSWLLDNIVYCPVLFDAAEELLQAGKKDAAAILYEGVAVTEHSQHSERLALCQYRLFTIKLGDDQAQNLQAAAQFELYVDRLDEVLQLDALKDLANVYRSLREWNKVDKFAEQMGTKARMHYFAENRHNRKVGDPYSKLSRPLFVYIAYSDLLRGEVCHELAEYGHALQFILNYTDLSWVKENDEEVLRWKGLFQEWAKTNTYVTKLYSGDLGVLPEYVEHIKIIKDDILLSLLNIAELANRFNVNVDQIFEHFRPEILLLTEGENIPGNYYNQRLIVERLTRLFSELSEYFLQKGEYMVGFKYLLNSLEKSATINYDSNTVKCVGLFENYRNYASPEIQSDYQKLFREVYQNEKNNRLTPIRR